MMASARRTILALDSSKFDKVSFIQIAGLDDVDGVVTDREPPQEWKDYFDALSLECRY